MTRMTWRVHIDTRCRETHPKSRWRKGIDMLEGIILTYWKELVHSTSYRVPGYMRLSVNPCPQILWRVGEDILLEIKSSRYTGAVTDKHTDE